ncbi:FprA family A-type flavoprotein [Paludicola sp. MB14-C6]|uniref:FprA family A-type flavoprotein n=1 Tax=Paludihabitans sp. MB14-C6 TaxID=3070656 RepID=UPI0027DD6227|nr:FprA family A-type flavoprotein [Paludicola sp. MB14-C6]WMJ23397.1 FprA family A-type flavoprotein [Paludicola sp. MB14-C6]
MNINEIKDNVYSVSVLNPNLRVFDIVMTTDNGTSYNSYIVKGSEKTALIETAHLNYFDYFINNIKEVAELESVEYLIMNHNEPDHSGSIAKLLDLLPNLKIVTSQAGSIYIKNIINRNDANIIVAKNGDSIDLGDKTLTFFSAPFLHWPDSMFTYLKEDKVLFSCDFLGSHYCEPELFDTNIHYYEEYSKALKGYFDAIFGPFKPYVVKGLNIVKELDFDCAAPSHGPVLTKHGLLDEVIAKYTEWSNPTVHNNKQIPIFYCSAYGNTQLIAESIAVGIKETITDANIELLDIIKYDMNLLSQKLNESDAFLVGSPTINKDAVPPVWVLLSHVDAINIAKKPTAVFGSYGWSGEATKFIRQRLESLKTNVYEEDFRITFVPTESDLNKAKEFGKAFALTI